jgi:hypothetical protein
MQVAEFQQKIHSHLSSTTQKLKVLLKSLLKAQLRCDMIKQLSMPQPKPKPLAVKALDSLVAEYLLSQGLDFTLSVFLPESSLGSLSNVIIVRVIFIVELKSTRYHARFAIEFARSFFTCRLAIVLAF